MKLLSTGGWLVVVLSLFLGACNKPQPGPTATPSSSSPAATAATFDHKAFDELLATYVNKDGGVDYAGFKTQRAKLDQYLTTLAVANPQNFPNDAERLAFWINSYNAFTLADVLDDVLGKAKSVREVKGFFDQKKHKIAGEELTLDQIEKKGRDLKDPRIHFAVNCASMSCPKLQPQVYTGAMLDAQLTKVARAFLADSGRGLNYLEGKNIVYLSPIFKWYAADFTDTNSVVARLKAEASGEELLDVAKKYLPAEVAQFFTEKKPKVAYLEYDWSLNSKENNP
ncbi:MAG: DUF547 domain-containing protein [Blastocatellia bacterium]|nr:DUF547 domain-containing protein [Blastocatellia bacterium]